MKMIKKRIKYQIKKRIAKSKIPAVVRQEKYSSRPFRTMDLFGVVMLIEIFAIGNNLIKNKDGSSLPYDFSEGRNEFISR